MKKKEEEEKELCQEKRDKKVAMFINIIKYKVNVFGGLYTFFFFNFEVADIPKIWSSQMYLDHFKPPGTHQDGIGYNLCNV